jgi:hypothetical protein
LQVAGVVFLLRRSYIKLPFSVGVEFLPADELVGGDDEGFLQRQGE